MRTLVAGFLSLCFFMDPAVHPFTWLNFKKTLVKKEVHRRIVAGFEDSDLVLLTFSEEESESLLHWEHPREFEYEGQMYDVVDTWTLGETVYYRCWCDREETALLSRMRDLAARELAENPKLGEEGDTWKLSLKSSAFPPAKKCEGLTPESLGQRTWALSDFYASFILRPPTPPPRPS